MTKTLTNPKPKRTPGGTASAFHGAILPTGFQPDHERLSLKECEQALMAMLLSRESIQWAVGRLINLAEAWHGEEYTQIIPDQFGERAKQTLKNWASVDRRVPDQVRRPPQRLTWSHHRAVAGLKDAAVQDRWLKDAEDHSWSAAYLFDRISGKVKDGEAANGSKPSEAAARIYQVTVKAERCQWFESMLDTAINRGDVEAWA